MIDTSTQLVIRLGLVVFEKLVVPLLLHLVFKIFDFDASGLYFVLQERPHRKISFLKKIVFLVQLFHCLINQLPTLPQLLQPTQIFSPLVNTFFCPLLSMRFFLLFPLSISHLSSNHSQLFRNHPHTSI